MSLLFFLGDSIDRIFSEFYMDLERPVWDKKAKIRSCKLGLSELSKLESVNGIWLVVQ